MEGVKPPGDLRLNEVDNLAEQWKFWKLKFKLYHQAVGIKKDDKERKVSLFLTLAGDDAIKLHANYKFNNVEDEYDYEVIIKIFDDYCLPKDNVFYDRCNFEIFSHTL